MDITWSGCDKFEDPRLQALRTWCFDIYADMQSLIREDQQKNQVFEFTLYRFRLRPGLNLVLCKVKNYVNRGRGFSSMSGQLASDRGPWTDKEAYFFAGAFEGSDAFFAQLKIGDAVADCPRVSNSCTRRTKIAPYNQKNYSSELESQRVVYEYSTKRTVFSRLCYQIIWRSLYSS